VVLLNSENRTKAEKLQNISIFQQVSKNKNSIISHLFLSEHTQNTTHWASDS